MLPNHRLDQPERSKGRLLPVALAIHLSQPSDRVAVAARGWYRRGLVCAREEPAGQRIVDHDGEAVALAGGDEFPVERSRDGVVHPLVDGGAHPVVVLAVEDDLRDLEGGEVGEAELAEFASVGRRGLVSAMLEEGRLGVGLRHALFV